jgi:DnaJ-domain-containing protein 1
MVESHDELLMEIAREMGLDRMGEEMRKKKRMLTTEEMPLHHHLWCPLLPCLRRSTKRALWRRSRSKKL